MARTASFITPGPTPTTRPKTRSPAPVNAISAPATDITAPTRYANRLTGENEASARSRAAATCCMTKRGA